MQVAWRRKHGGVRGRLQASLPLTPCLSIVGNLRVLSQLEAIVRHTNAEFELRICFLDGGMSTWIEEERK